MFKAAVALLVLLVAGAMAQQLDLTKLTTTGELDGMTDEVLQMVGTAIADIEKSNVVNPTAAEKATLENEAKNYGALQYIDFLPIADYKTLLGYRDGATAQLDTANAAYLAYRAGVAANITAFLNDWKAKLANLTANRDLAVTDAQSLLERAKATIIYEVANVAKKVVAAGIYILRARGQATELNFNAVRAGIWVLNNSIAGKNMSALGGFPWTVETNATLVKERCIAIATAFKIAEWRLNKLIALEATIKAAIAAEVAALQAKIAAFKATAATAITKLKAAWADAAAKDALAGRIAAFLNASGVTVTVANLGQNNMTVTVTLTKDDFEVTLTAQQIKDWIAKRVKILLLAYAGSELGGIAENQVTTDASSVTTMKRAGGSYSVTSNVGVGGSSGGNGNSASTLAASMALLAASLAALFM